MNIVYIVLLIFIACILLGNKSKRETFSQESLPNLYYINMKKSKERNSRFISRLEGKSLRLFNNVKRIDAITPLTLDRTRNIIPEKCKDNSRAEMSCSLSHLKAIHTAYHDNVEYALIMEDDMYFMVDPDWKEIIQSAPTDWEVLQLFTFYAYVYEEYNKSGTKWVEHVPRFMASTGAYIINRAAMERLLSQFIPDEYTIANWDDIQNITFKNVLSECNADYFLYKHLKTYVHTLVLFNAEGFDSEIHPEHLGYHNQSKEEINKIKDIQSASH